MTDFFFFMIHQYFASREHYVTHMQLVLDINNYYKLNNCIMQFQSSDWLSHHGI